MVKIRVNDPCWCGSGQTLKKCHGRGTAPADNVVPTATYELPRDVPNDVRRALRQEAGFGCARCGHPYIEFHHIVPFAEERHHRSEDMIALCGQCHPAVAKFGRDRQRLIKANPHNIKSGQFHGALEFDKRDLVFKVGGNWYDNTPVILQYMSTPIISCRLNEGQAKVSLNLLSSTDQPLLKVIDNDVSFRVSDLWDFEYAHNVAVARYRKGNVALRLDFRGAEATIEGHLWIGGRQVTLGPDKTSLGNNVMSGNRTSGCQVGIQIGAPSPRLARNLPLTLTLSP